MIRPPRSISRLTEPGWRKVSLLLALPLCALMGARAAAALQELPWWIQAGLTQEDVGPGFEFTRSEFFSQEGFASYVVQLERAATPGAGGTTLIGSMLIRNDRNPAQPSFDELASALVRARPGLLPAEGPAVGDDTRWYAGPWSEPPEVDEAHVLVARLGETVLSIAIAGDPGGVRQEDALAFATLVADRLERLGLTPTPAPTPLPQATPTAEPTRTPAPLPFPPTATGRPDAPPVATPPRR